MSANSAQECMTQVQEAATEVRSLLEQLPSAASATVTSEHAYKKAYNAALVKYGAERSDLARAKAEIDTETQGLAYEQAKSNEKRIKESLHSWRSILSALQTVTTAYREEARFSRTGPSY